MESLKKEGNESVTKCNQLKLESADGKKYLTDVGSAETILRLIQSIPSPKAELIKLWLAKVGYERIQEMTDPERSLDRARETWQKHGRSEKWIQQRMMGQETRNKLTNYWKEHDVKQQQEFAILTNSNGVTQERFAAFNRRSQCLKNPFQPSKRVMSPLLNIQNLLPH